MSTEVPVFNLTQSSLGFADEKEFQSAMEGGRGFNPGNFDLKVVSAARHSHKDSKSIWCKGDSTWFGVMVEFAGPEDRKCKYYLQVPTVSLKYGPKGQSFPARKLMEFFAGLGIQCSLADSLKVIPQWFADPAKLVGRTCNADFDYEGAHLKKDGEDWVIVRADGQPMKDEKDAVMKFADRDGAKACAEGMGLELTGTRIVKFHAKAAAPKADNDQW